MRPFIILLLLIVSLYGAPAQTLDTLEALVNNGRLVDAKLYHDKITDSTVLNSMRCNLLAGKLYQELFKQSLQEFGIKNNNWLATSCNAYIDGVALLAKQTRIPDSLYLIIADCYEHCTMEAMLEDSTGSRAMAADLYYAGHHSATLWSLLSGLPVKDHNVLYGLGMYFYKLGTSTQALEQKQAHFARAKHYLKPLTSSNRNDVIEALKVIGSN